MTQPTSLPDAEQLFEKFAQQIAPLIQENSAIVGIYSGGAWLAERLVPLLDQPVPHGILDVSFYRDDFAKRGLHKENIPSQIPFDVEGKHIILIDDVFYTGRTVRAAMNELFDYGRPASISLAVLVDRGGRELPITPQVCVMQMQLPVTQSLQLQRQADGRFHLTLEKSH
jgi:pyrimidine operon attenuation protein / uracil phosphoribosyltransferase